MNKDLPTPVPARAILSVLFGRPPLVILLKYSRSNSILSSFTIPRLVKVLESSLFWIIRRVHFPVKANLRRIATIGLKNLARVLLELNIKPRPPKAKTLDFKKISLLAKEE